MADDTYDTTPGSAPGVLKTSADGGLPENLGGRTAWVWMQDTEEGGGGRFDVRADRVDMWRRKGATVVPNYPVHFGPAGRTAKPAAQLAGNPAGAVAAPTVTGGTPAEQPQPAPADPTLAMPASALGAVEPADDRQPDDAGTLAEPADRTEPADERLGTRPAADAGESGDQAAGDEHTDQADGEPAPAKTTTRKGGRTR